MSFKPLTKKMNFDEDGHRICDSCAWEATSSYPAFKDLDAQTYVRILGVLANSKKRNAEKAILVRAHTRLLKKISKSISLHLEHPFGGRK